MDINLPNAAPQHLALGIYDGSGRQVDIVPEALPTHLPKFYIFAEQGDTKPVLVSGAGLMNTFGDNTFKVRSPYFNHATALLRIINSAGNMCMVQRVVPDDAGPKPTLRLSLDVLETQLPDYERDQDGNVRYDQMGNPIELSTFSTGYLCAWITEVIEPDSNGIVPVGGGVVKDGYQTDPNTSTISKLYPILDLQVPYIGSAGNNNGIRIFAPTQNELNGIDLAILQNEKAYPFRMQMIQREDENSVGRVVNTPAGSQHVDFVFKPEVVDRRFGEFPLSISDVVIDSYQSVDVPGYLDRLGPFKDQFTYYDNIERLTALFYAAEMTSYGFDGDFTGEADEAYRFNFVSGTHSNGTPYRHFRINSSLPESHSLNRNSVAYAGGGSDGTMNNAVFAQLVGEQLKRYADVYDEVLDDARNVESIFYDSGFPLSTKYDLMKFIALRKDTFVVLSVFDADGTAYTAEQETSLALALKTMAQMYPESEFFGTKTCRAMIVGRSGIHTGTDYKKRVPLTFELAEKAANFMGAGNGRWDMQARFDHAPGSIVERMNKINVTYTPVPVRHRDWDNGLVWVQSYDRERVHFPALQTVYDDDTSILNNFVTAMVCVDLQKIGARLTRYFQGATLTNGQLKERTERLFRDWTKDKYSEHYTVEPETVITGLDEQRGYSWFTRAKLWGPNMKTVGIYTVEAYRADDLVAGA